MWRQQFESHYHPSPAQERKETGRVEALSDGVFAIAMTLLVLSIPIPSRDAFLNLKQPTTLFDFAVIRNSTWLSYIAYVVSFLTILVMWVNHHSMFQFLGRIDRFFVMANGLLLMMVVFVNYPTVLVADFIGTSGGTFAATALSGTFVIISILYQALWRRIITGGRLLASDVDRAEVAQITRQYNFGAPVYLVAFALAFFSPAASVAVTAGLAIFFMFTGRITRRVVPRRQEEEHQHAEAHHQPPA